MKRRAKYGSELLCQRSRVAAEATREELEGAMVRRGRANQRGCLKRTTLAVPMAIDSLELEEPPRQRGREIIVGPVDEFISQRRQRRPAGTPFCRTRSVVRRAHQENGD